MKGTILTLLFTLTSACASGPVSTASVGNLVLAGSDGTQHELGRTLGSNELSVFVFYSENCPCLQVHEARLAELARAYAPRGVGVYLVNSEVGATAAHDQAEAARRGYPLLLLTDPDARLARSWNAEFATYSVVVDRAGRVRYAGALDSDKGKLHDDAEMYVENALDALLQGREPPPSGEALGCVLQLH